MRTMSDLDVYTISQAQRILRETLAPTTVPRVTLSRTRYVVDVGDALHQVRHDGICNCGGSPQSPCPAHPLVQAHLAAGGAKSLGRHPDTWPECWTTMPPLCPVCDCPTLADPYLNSAAGPGWKCSRASYRHFWLVRMNPFLAENPHPPNEPLIRTSNPCGLPT
jgi:hypothetical protein